MSAPNDDDAAPPNASAAPAPAAEPAARPAPLAPPATLAPPAFGGAAMKTADDVAAFFGVERAKLLYALYKAPNSTKYATFEIPKRTGGMRRIASPQGLVRELQYALLPHLRAALDVHPNAHGFLNKRSIVTNAKDHLGAKWVLNIDLADFFPSINFGRVRGLFMARPFFAGEAAATILAQICTFENGLPQGAPTSPVLSNYIASALDRRLRRLAGKHKLEYSRYADDITFSSRAPVFPPLIAVRAHAEGARHVVEPGDELARAVEACGFEINAKKVRLQGRGVRQSVTGLTVNQKLSPPRKRIRMLRAMIHAWAKYGLPMAASEHFNRYAGGAKPKSSARGRQASYRNMVYGHLAFLGMARGREDALYLKYCEQLLKVDDAPPRFLRRLVFRGADYEVFIGHASEDKDAVAWPLYDACERLGLKTFLDRPQIMLGEQYTDKIEVAMSAAKVFVAVLSPITLDKAYARKEIDAAQVRADKGLMTIAPVRVGDPDLTEKPFLDNLNALFWEGDPEPIARALYKAVRGEDPPEPQPPEDDEAVALAAAAEDDDDGGQRGPWGARPGPDPGPAPAEPAPAPRARKGLFGGLFKRNS